MGPGPPFFHQERERERKRSLAPPRKRGPPPSYASGHPPPPLLPRFLVWIPVTRPSLHETLGICRPLVIYPLFLIAIEFSPSVWLHRCKGPLSLPPSPLSNHVPPSDHAGSTAHEHRGKSRTYAHIVNDDDDAAIAEHRFQQIQHGRPLALARHTSTPPDRPTARLGQAARRGARSLDQGQGQCGDPTSQQGPPTHDRVGAGRVEGCHEEFCRIDRRWDADGGGGGRS